MPVTNRVRVIADVDYVGRSSGDSTSVWVDSADALKYTAADGTAVTVSAIPTTFLTDAFTIADASDDTKQVTFDASGITAGQTSVLTVPDADLTLVGTATTQTLTNKTLTTPTLTSPTVNTPSVVELTEVVAATNILAASESGKTCFLASATEFVSTLPTVATAGTNFTFYVSAAPSGASYTVVPATGTTILGNIVSTDGAASTFTATGTGTVTFVDGKAVKGDRAYFISDGTNWYVTAQCSVHDAITFS
jgi:hypothetical protein